MSKRFERIPRSDYERELLDKAAALLPASARTPTMSLASAMIVREGRGFEHLLREREPRADRHAALHAVLERALAQRIGDGEQPVDELRVLDREDVGVVESRGQAHFLAEVLEHARRHVGVRGHGGHRDAGSLCHAR